MVLETLNHIRSNVCSIGYMGKKLSPKLVFDVVSDHVIVGTGFLIAKNRIITNRHVLDHLRETIDNEHWTVLFYNSPDNDGKMHLFQSVEGVSFAEFPNTAQNLNYSADIAVLTCQGDLPDHFYEERTPVNLGNLDDLSIGMDVAISGYLSGTSLLKFESIGCTRGGPITFFGRVAALAPWEYVDPTKSYTAILTDISNGGGFSGSPLYSPESGQIYGMHGAGITESGLGYAFPLDQKRINDILQVSNSTFKFEEMKGVRGVRIDLRTMETGEVNLRDFECY